ncbi:MAG: hypothetical protein A3K68_01440 [Euryarchaeota archaeon RBG_16_68_13]|nr:MAG: hypothetical protein A3K68_01440 [Euryarchaeota archaeon RBG_16_68_13]
MLGHEALPRLSEVPRDCVESVLELDRPGGRFEALEDEPVPGREAEGLRGGLGKDDRDALSVVDRDALHDRVRRGLAAVALPQGEPRLLRHEDDQEGAEARGLR